MKRKQQMPELTGEALECLERAIALGETLTKIIGDLHSGAIRRALGMTQEKFAQAIDVTVRTVARWETKTKKNNPSVEDIKKVGYYISRLPTR